MPIGVPKVAYRLPGEPEPQWVDLYQRMFRERVMFMCNELGDELANQLIGVMLHLNSLENNEEDLYMYINSPGGSATAGIAVYDIINYVTADVTTIAAGTAASMASFVLTGGTRGRRIAFPNARIMIHQPEGGSQGQASEVILESEEVIRIRKQVGQIYSDRTGQSVTQISKDMDRDQFMSAREAKVYGLVDHIPLNMPNYTLS